ncbi:MAG: N-acetylmuramoyl-L-alanine amidase [Lachnospiraceae bacterium]|jgi:hypothetical protein|nr:N-acetylmuramoyl-L-alanine amidase [Lachnospiraceae bacterium]
MQFKKNGFFSIWLLLFGFCAASGIVLFFCYQARIKLPDYIGRELTSQERESIISRNSPYIQYINLTANADFPRNSKITKITVHHMAGDLSLEALGESFSRADRKASANYAIDSSGQVALYVEECNRAWTSSSRDNDHQAVTVEVANDEMGGEWHVSDASYEMLVELCVDICRRNHIRELIYTGDETGNLTIHKMFSNQTECPGPYLESRMAELADTVTQRLNAP